MKLSNAGYFRPHGGRRYTQASGLDGNGKQEAKWLMCIHLF